MSGAIKILRVKQAPAIGVAAMLACVSAGALAQTAARPPQTAVKPRAATQAPAVQPSSPAATQGAVATADAGKSSGNDNVIARIGDINVSADDIRGYVAALGQREQVALARDPSLLSQTVRQMLANRLVFQEVQAKKWDQQPAVAAQLERVRESAVVELYLQTVSNPPASFPSEEDLQKVYDANSGAFLMPRQFQLAQIFVAGPKDADKATDEKARKSLDDIQRRLKAPGADFAAVAAEGEAGNGGDLGWLTEGQIRPEIRTQVMGLAKNAISEPIRLDDGWHILKLVDTKASYTRTLPEVRDQLVQQLRAERARLLRQAHLNELLKQHPPVLNEIALSKVLGEQTRTTK
ncbi:peptidylprolyl isomerase [Bradyrhizobium genosp. A]|uniref:peptidylprolyl isomerase n=1 Tax=Bradyrhizobium genosp. A TaxID=83626 RepID=UPI003CF907AA